MSKFKGELNEITPSFLVTESNRVEGFFLGLGVVFNDLKGFVLFEKMLQEKYEAPSADEITSHAGNYSGVLVQIQKLAASTINEFFVFLEKNTVVFKTNEFKEISNRLSKSDKVLLDGMVSAANGNLPGAEGLLKTLVKIRSNIAFHYDHSGKILRNAYVSRFFGDAKDAKNKFAYYSLGDSIELTRFYFSDAAVEEAIHIAAGKKPKECSKGDSSLAKYYTEVREALTVVGSLIMSLLKNYIQLRRNRPS